MDNNAHAHPSTPSAIPRPTYRLREDDAATPPSRQQRLLRSRNARFPAKKISISGISARFSELIRTHDGKTQTQTPAHKNQENLVYKKHRTLASASQSTSTLSILEEITNSIGGKTRTSQNRPPIPVFQDTPERALLDSSPWVSPSLYHDASSLVGSPPVFDHIQDSLPMMGLREISGNARKSSTPESSPFPGSGRSARRKRSTQKLRFETEEYIEHIEKELELVKDKVFSPNTNRPWKEKLKVAKAENERLRAEIRDMKTAFEAEVQKTVEHMTTTEVGLRRKVRSLEDELEQKDFTINDLEAQHDEKRLDQGTFENLRNTIEKLEQEKQSLEQSNDSMSKRNEVLTQLLAISPSKTHHPSEPSSPVRSRSNARPRSLMILRNPSSPGNARASRPQSVLASPAPSAACYFSPPQATESLPPCYSDATVRNMRGDISVDSGLGESCSIPSNSCLGSRRSTLASQASMSPTLWGIPLPVAASQDQPKAQQKRRARRFLPGSTQLKPLLLPTLTGENGALNMTSPVTSPQRTQLRDFSEESIDPTTMFLSQSPTLYEADKISLPTMAAPPLPLDQELTEHHFRSFELAFEPPSDPLDVPESLADPSDLPAWSQQSISEQLQRLESLELGSLKSPNSDYINAWMSSPRPESIAEEAEKTILPAQSAHPPDVQSPIVADRFATGQIVIRDRALSLDHSPEESSSVEVPQPLFSPSARRGTYQNTSPGRTEPQKIQGVMLGQTPAMPSTDEAQTSRKRRKISSSSLLLDNGEVFRMQALSQENNFRPAPLQLSDLKPLPLETNIETVSRSSSRSSSISLRSPQRVKSPLEILQQSGIARPLVSVTIKTIYGTLSRYTTYIREMKKDPLALARRVLANAWHLNWKLMGKLSWWVLGLFLGSSRRKAQYFDWEDYDAQSIAERQVESQHLLPTTPTAERHVHFEDQHDSYRTRGSKSAARPALKRKKLGWGQSLLLWGNFSVAIMMAVGGAVVKGPAEMLKDADERKKGHRNKRGPRVGLPGHDDHERYNISPLPMQPTVEDFGLDPGDDDDETVLCDAPRVNLRRRNSNSPPPSARSLLQDHGSIFASHLPSPMGSDSPSPAPYHFGSGSNEIFPFDPPATDTDWGDFEGGNTLKPKGPKRASLDSLFDSPPPAGNQEYDPESAPFGPDFDIFSPLSNKNGQDGGMRVRVMELEGDVLECENG